MTVSQNNFLPTIGGVSLNQSVVADYQMRLVEKQREVADLQKQKEELKLMQEKLLAMQATYELEVSWIIK